MGNRLRLILCQFHVREADPTANLSRAEEMIAAHAAPGTLFLLPELWTTGPLNPASRAAAAETPRILLALQGLCSATGSHVVGTVPVEHEGSLYNSTHFAWPGGAEEVYRKINLFPLMGEERLFRPGVSPGHRPLQLNGGETLLGFATCYDIRFPELARHLAWLGMEVLLLSALWPAERIEHLLALAKARAIENQCFVAVANACGETAGYMFGGNSSVFGPGGEEVARCGTDEEVAVAELDLGVVARARRRFNTATPPVGWSRNQGGRVMELADLQRETERRKAAGQIMVFTNGCFDLLHPGHVAYLEEARAHGHFLVVGLNSDASVRRLKGDARPINPAQARASVLMGLASVDYVTIFDDDTPLRLIEALRPDVLVKGADWAEEEIAGAREVKSWGGKVVRIPFTHQVSTTTTIHKILKSHSRG